MDKLIHAQMPNGKTEMSYIKEEMFNKLMAKGFVRWDGMWIQHPVLWPEFFKRLTNDN